MARVDVVVVRMHIDIFLQTRQTNGAIIFIRYIYISRNLLQLGGTCCTLHLNSKTNNRTNQLNTQ